MRIETGSRTPNAVVRDLRIVYNALLGGWFIVRGEHQTPIGGRFESREEALYWLRRPRIQGRKPHAYSPRLRNQVLGRV